MKTNNKIQPIIKRFLPATLVVSVIALSAAGALAQGTQATITRIRKSVEMNPSMDPAAWRAAQMNAVLGVGQGVRTLVDSVAELTYTDGTLFRLAPTTSLTLQEKEYRILKLLLGKLWIKHKKGSGTLKVQTPSVVASITAQEEIFDVSESGATRVVVLETDPNRPVMVQIIDAQGNAVGNPVSLKSGQALEAKPGETQLGNPFNIDVDAERAANTVVTNPEFGAGAQAANPAQQELNRTTTEPVQTLLTNPNPQELGGSSTTGTVEVEVK